MVQARRVPQLDGVRGIAILVVMIHNLGAFTLTPFSYVTTYGWMGVDLFFVLSGFLITGILLGTRNSEHYFRNFYVRRCLRIWPLYYTVLLFVFVVIPIVRHQFAAEIFQRASPWWSYFVFLQNFLVASPQGAFGALGVTWSLAVEELFYLVWPLVVRFLSSRQLEATALAVVIFSPVLRLFLSWHGVLIYSNPFCRLDGLMLGALLALLEKKSIQKAVWTRYAWAVLAAAALLAIESERLSARWFTFSMVVMASAAFVYLAVHSGEKWFGRVLSNRFLTFTGIISYGLYLLHKFPHDVLMAMHLQLHPSVAFFPVVAGAYLMAVLSWNLLEKPFLRLKSRFEFTPESE
jgi:peptidoglycan/LPS O-acetylase OafA/YrhL